MKGHIRIISGLETVPGNLPTDAVVVSAAMTFFSTKEVDLWTGGYTHDARNESSYYAMGYSGAAAAVLNDLALVVGGRDLAGETLHDSCLAILFDTTQQRIVYDYDVDGSLPRRIGHDIAALPSKNAWFVFGGESIVDDDDGDNVLGGRVLAELTRVSYTNNVLQWEKMQFKGAEEPAPRAWHTLTAIRYRPPPEVATTQKGKANKEASQATIQVVELDHALLLLGGKDAGRDVWVFLYDKQASSSSDEGDTTESLPAQQTPKWIKLNTDGASPLPLAHHTSQALGEGTRVAVCGGVRGGTSLADTISILDVLTTTWSTVVTSPLVQRSFHTMVWVQVPVSAQDDSLLFPRLTEQSPVLPSVDRLVIFGGITADDVAPMDEFVVVDMVTATATTVTADLALPSRMGHAVVVSPDRRLLFSFGGTHATTHHWLDATSRVDLWTYQHEPLPPPPPERMRTLEYPNGDVYLGELNDKELRHGIGRCTYKAGHVYEGHWANDVWEGDGRLEYANGDVYAGTFGSHVRDGKGRLVRAPMEASSTGSALCERAYEGEWQQDRRHGAGVVEYSNGATLKGTWTDDVLDASVNIVIEQYDDQTAIGLYEGAVDVTAPLHPPHGQGRFEMTGYPKAGEMYSGGWVHGKREGQGICMAFDGTVFMGEWKNGKRNGFGTCDYAKTRDRYEGKWVGDVRCGLGTCTYAAGFVYEGQWAHDKRHGDGRCTYKDGTFYEGHWENDEFCGDGALILQAP
ncbi:Aste57867_24112 [Aphanomyces stellatus]|uniref:Aste57867_24112 protein n=1 Tax=Aphanomyces stellatus TaxID=120398 RepID=A0A485LRC7_9STRA|nr:hypothetical protein As57867_024038 [Aphanomyces stellatus]VFU00754.1 Aste57867_24112 [Aphanomyces stellatus]